MSIEQKTRDALSALFGDQPALSPAEADGADGSEKQAGSRANGIIDQDYSARGFHLDVQIDADQVIEAAKIMFELDYFLESITGVDWIKEGQLEVVYDFARYDFTLCRTVLRTRISRTEPRLPTITSVYTGAAWHERETHDFFGIVFQGHPHLIPLLLPEDADFHPLLKDFKA
jgi:NADH-quinone oxidoreductase subunit C